VTVAFWTNWFQTPLIRHAADNLFQTGPSAISAIYSRLAFTVNLTVVQKIPDNQFTARCTDALLTRVRRASLFGLKPASRNSQF
jgi:hypothetical protein